MQDHQKNPDTSKTRNSLEILPGAVKTQDSPKPVEASKLHNYLDKRQTSETSDDRKAPDAVDTRTSLVTADATESEDATEPLHAKTTSSAPSVWSSLKSPLLALTALVSVLGAAWNYTTLENTRVQLTAVSNAKASVEMSLAEAQGRLAAAEKAVADVKAALTALPAAAAAKATLATEPAAVAVPQ